MATSGADRLRHIRERIALITEMFSGATYEEAWRDETRWAAFERHLEVISEASRNIPPEWRTDTRVEWRKVAGLGNLLRHVYQHTSGPVLWDIYENDLVPLDEAVAAMLLRYGSDDSPTPSPPRSS